MKNADLDVPGLEPVEKDLPLGQCFPNSIPENVPQRPTAGIDTMGLLPCALNVKVKKFNDMQVNGGGNHHSVKVAKRLVIELVTRING